MEQTAAPTNAAPITMEDIRFRRTNPGVERQPIPGTPEYQVIIAATGLVIGRICRSDRIPQRGFGRWYVSALRPLYCYTRRDATEMLIRQYNRGLVSQAAV